MKKEIKKIIDIPEKIEVKIDNHSFTVKGPLGESKDKFKFKNLVKVEKKENKIEISCKKATKKEKKIIGTIENKLGNMISGVSKEYVYELQICSVHFPITVKIENDRVVIKNFLGENKDRGVKVIPGANVKIEGDKIKVSSIDKEKAGQMAADIENITRVRRYDRRVFQDGIWIIKKEKGRRK
jgi:large subunit ribosomal protein L6